MPSAPAAARGVVVSTRVSHHESTGIIRHSRTRMVLTVSFVISPVTGLSCHRRQRNRFRQLDTSVGVSGPHDFAVRESLPQQPLDGFGTGPAEALGRRVSVIRLLTLPRPPHPVPTSVTIAIRPSSGTGWRQYGFDLGSSTTSQSCGTMARRANHAGRGEARVKGLSSFRGARSANYDVQLHIGESRDSGSGPADHPGMTTHVASTEARNSSAFSRVGKRPTSR
jgi:hypothetical protein